jgi:hypothetical protein
LSSPLHCRKNASWYWCPTASIIIDRYQPVVLPLELPVVLLDDVDLVLQAGLAYALPRQVGLFGGDGGRGDAAAVVTGSVERPASPACADLEHMVARLQLQLAAAPLHFADGGLVQRAVGIGVHGRRVHHRGVEEERKEVVPQVIVSGNVALASAPAVAP